MYNYMPYGVRGSISHKVTEVRLVAGALCDSCDGHGRQGMRGGLRHRQIIEPFSSRINILIC